MTITTRTTKGSELTHAEMDTNFTDLRDGIALQVPKMQNSGIKVDSLGTPTYPWHDIIGQLHVDATDLNAAQFVTYRGTIKARQFGALSEAFIEFHLPHDYVMGTPIYLHVHWSHASSLVTGGSLTWGIECMYAKGHDQDEFDSPVIVTIADFASTIAYRHLIAEAAASTEGGSGVQLDTNLLEPDGIIQCRIYLDSNDMAVSSGDTPAPFVHFVDVHYQSTCVGTKQRQPDFWT